MRCHLKRISLSGLSETSLNHLFDSRVHARSPFHCFLLVPLPDEPYSEALGTSLFVEEFLKVLGRSQLVAGGRGGRLVPIR